MSLWFSTVPQGFPGKPQPFNLHISNDHVSDFQQLLSASKIGPATWWNEQKDHRFGVSREWLIRAKDTGLTTFDWHKHEEQINDFPNFKILVNDPDAGPFDIHFAALEQLVVFLKGVGEFVHKIGGLFGL